MAELKLPTQKLAYRVAGHWNPGIVPGDYVLEPIPEGCKVEGKVTIFIAVPGAAPCAWRDGTHMPVPAAKR